MMTSLLVATFTSYNCLTIQRNVETPAESASWGTRKIGVKTEGGVLLGIGKKKEHSIRLLNRLTTHWEEAKPCRGQ